MKLRLDMWLRAPGVVAFRPVGATRRQLASLNRALGCYPIDPFPQMLQDCDEVVFRANLSTIKAAGIPAPTKAELIAFLANKEGA